MAGNRVEELEAKVRELEATINGLTDELIETKERVRTLEAEIDPDLDRDIIEGRPTRTAARDGDESSDDDVAEAVDGTGADEAKGEEPHNVDNADSGLGDDIIVA